MGTLGESVTRLGTGALMFAAENDTTFQKFFDSCLVSRSLGQDTEGQRLGRLAAV